MIESLSSQIRDQPRSLFDATVVSNELICREHFRLRLRVLGDFPATRPGQFVQLGCREPDAAIDMQAVLGHVREWLPGERVALIQPELCEPLALLRRPFSLAGRGDDADGTWIEIIHRVVGVGTQWLSQLAVGDAVDLIGPLGNHFAMPPDKSIGLLVGGGVGLPPMFYLAEALAAAGWQGVGFVGAMTDDLLAVTFDQSIVPTRDGTPARSTLEFARVGFDSVITTDDGSVGMNGFVTGGVEKMMQSMSEADRAKAVVFTCGPEPMMHAVAELAAAHRIDCQVCLEQAMACGMGTCQSCIVKIEQRAGDPLPAHDVTGDGTPWRYRLACTDGPVFDANEVVW